MGLPPNDFVQTASRRRLFFGKMTQRMSSESTYCIYLTYLIFSPLNISNQIQKETRETSQTVKGKNADPTPKISPAFWKPTTLCFWTSYNVVLCAYLRLKHLKEEFHQTFIHLHLIQNLYMTLSSVEDKQRYLMPLSFCINMKVNGA